MIVMSGMQSPTVLCHNHSADDHDCMLASNCVFAYGAMAAKCSSCVQFATDSASLHSIRANSCATHLCYTQPLNAICLQLSLAKLGLACPQIAGDG